jgi:hypothetical protein
MGFNFHEENRTKVTPNILSDRISKPFEVWPVFLYEFHGIGDASWGEIFKYLGAMKSTPRTVLGSGRWPPR